MFLAKPSLQGPACGKSYVGFCILPSQIRVVKVNVLGPYELSAWMLSSIRVDVTSVRTKVSSVWKTYHVGNLSTRVFTRML
jgi:hypothetical protein